MKNEKVKNQCRYSVCRFEFKPVELAKVHIPLNVSASHGESLAYGMENGKEILNSYYSPSGRHLSCIDNMMCLCNKRTSMPLVSMQMYCGRIAV